MVVESSNIAIVMMVLPQDNQDYSMRHHHHIIQQAERKLAAGLCVLIAAQSCSGFPALMRKQAQQDSRH